MGTQEVKLERAGEKSAVDCSDPVCSFIHNIIIDTRVNVIHSAQNYYSVQLCPIA